MSPCNFLNTTTVDSLYRYNGRSPLWQRGPLSPANIKKINEYCSNVQFNVQMIVNVKEIQDIIHVMPIGKAPGYDSVSSEHFKYANEKLHVHMSLLYNSMLIHFFLPDARMITIIAPIIKNKAGDLSDNNNYRPIALATIASKLFESLILSRVSTFLSTCVNQFGFKKHHSTEMLIFFIKRTLLTLHSEWLIYVCYYAGCF